MDLLWDGLREAFGLLVSGDPEVRAIAWRSIEISATATLLSLLAGVPAGVLLALSPFPGRRLVVALVNTGMGLPPVVVALFVCITLWRSGPGGLRSGDLRGRRVVDGGREHPPLDARADDGDRAGDRQGKLRDRDRAQPHPARHHVRRELGADDRPAAERPAVSRPILAARDLEIRRGADLVLRVPALEVRQGEVLAIIGPNGAGKSSLLRVLALLEAPAAGELWFGGEKVEFRTRSLLALRRRMAVVFQEPLLCDMTVERNVALGLRLRGLDGARGAVERWLERLGVAPLR